MTEEDKTKNNRVKSGKDWKEKRTENKKTAIKDKGDFTDEFKHRFQTAISEWIHPSNKINAEKLDTRLKQHRLYFCLRFRVQASLKHAVLQNSPCPIKA